MPQVNIEKNAADCRWHILIAAVLFLLLCPGFQGHPGFEHGPQSQQMAWKDLPTGQFEHGCIADWGFHRAGTLSSWPSDSWH